jgi:hypothetical protein
VIPRSSHNQTYPTTSWSREFKGYTLVSILGQAAGFLSIQLGSGVLLCLYKGDGGSRVVNHLQAVSVCAG